MAIVGLQQLYADLRSGNVPALAFIAPNQCHDQHGRGLKEVGTGCYYNTTSFDQNGNVIVGSTPSQQLIAQGDATVQNLVTAIKSSPVWSNGNNAIVVVWDENDYSSLPNQVLTIVDTNYGPKGVTSNVQYNHFSLLKTLEAGFGLSYLNHAADPNVPLMTDLFGNGQGQNGQ